MSTINEVRAHEKKLKEVLDALAEAQPPAQEQLKIEVKDASDKYVKVWFVNCDVTSPRVLLRKESFARERKDR